MNYITIKRRFLMANENIGGQDKVTSNFIKNTRREKGWTLDYLSNGICSVSYLSKLENNKIVPQSSTVKLLCDKLGVQTPDIGIDIDFDIVTNTLIKSYFYQDLQSVEDLQTSEWMNFHLGLKQLALLLSYVLKRDYHQAELLMHDLNAQFGYLSKDGQTLYLLLISDIHLFKGKYKECINYCHLLKTHTQTCDYIIAKTESLLFIAKAHLKMTLSSVEHYHACMHLLNKHHATIEIFKLQLIYSRQIGKENPKAVKKLIDAMRYQSIPKQLYNMHTMTKVLLANSLNQKNLSQMLMKKIIKDKKDINYYTLQMERSKLNQSAIPFSLEECPDVLKSDYLIHFTKKSDNLEKTKTFLKTVVIPTAYDTQNIENLKIAFKRLIECSIKTRRYKEALAYTQKEQKMIESLTSFDI